MTLLITISLGNDAMQTPTDVIHALHKLANTLDDMSTLAPEDSGWIIDENGNRVGDWEVEP